MKSDKNLIKKINELEQIKKNIQTSYEDFKPNHERFHFFKNFAFVSSLSDKQISYLNILKKPPLEFNLGEAYLSRLRGEFSKQEPSINMGAKAGKTVDSGQLSALEGNFRAALDDANKNSFEYDIYSDLLAGGFSVADTWTDYEDEMSFKQIIGFGRVFDPTLCGFDMMAREPHKGDGKYCFKIHPKLAEDVEKEFNIKIDGIKFSQNIEGFTWAYKSDNADIVLVGEYSEKRFEKCKIVELSNGNTMTEDEYEERLEKFNKLNLIEQPPKVVDFREGKIEKIDKYFVIENKILNRKATDFKYLNLVFIDGNSVFRRNGNTVEQVTRPYLYQAKDVQQLVNFAGQTLAAWIEDIPRHKWKIAEESIIPEQMSAITDNQIPNNVIYKAYTQDDNNNTISIPPPQEIQPAGAPPEIMQTFLAGPQLMQAILGSYDAALGINDNQLSGVAIVEGATQSNATAMPYVKGFLTGLTRIAEIYVDLVPKYLVEPREIPITLPNRKSSTLKINQNGGIFFDYNPLHLKVNVEAGVNFAIQKNRALQQIIGLMKASPLFAQFMNEEGLEVLLDNLEIRGIDQIKELAKKYMQKLQVQKQQQQQMNPIVIKQQEISQKIQLEERALAQKAQKDQMDAQLKAAEIAVGKQDSDNDRLEIMADLEESRGNNLVQREKAQTEKFARAVDFAIKKADQKRADVNQEHTHAKETIELHHLINQSKEAVGANKNS